MNKKSIVFVVVACFAVASLAGCSGAQKKRDEEMKGIKTKVDTLESKVEGIESKQSEADKALAAKEAESMNQAGAQAANITPGSKIGTSKEDIKAIQAALRNAGFYSGKIDGVKGKQTRKAVKGFQRANGLTPDGVVGSRTWELLSRYSQGSGSVSGDVK
jgi:peptidoglycan hydrolase-like protein with peptidoglycan-binding domain